MLFKVFPDHVLETVVKAEGLNILTKEGNRYLDCTAGGTHYAIIGWSHPLVLEAMREQLSRFTHMDYKIWRDSNTEELASLLLSRNEHNLDMVYFCGNSGGEAAEASMKMSYQVHYDSGRPEKTWFISRTQSYHGSSTDAMAMGERPNLMFYQPLFPNNRAKVTEHNQYTQKREDESLDDYAKRSAKELETKILEIGPHKVAAFMGETIMGGLIGDVPPAPNYWKYIREVCDRYNVHLIMDEVYCGTGTSGKIYCCDWDGVTPDFLLLGKTLAAGYAPVSAVVTSNEIYDVISNGQGRLQHTTTHQAYSLGIAAALAVQRIIHDDQLLDNVIYIGNWMREELAKRLSSSKYWRNIRGRGLRFSLEVQGSERDLFTERVSRRLRDQYKILVSGKWHRFSFTPSLLISKGEAELVVDRFCQCFLEEERH